jgi:hypothetical protein
MTLHKITEFHTVLKRLSQHNLKFHLYSKIMKSTHNRNLIFDILFTSNWCVQ